MQERVGGSWGSAPWGTKQDTERGTKRGPRRRPAVGAVAAAAALSVAALAACSSSSGKTDAAAPGASSAATTSASAAASTPSPVAVSTSASAPAVPSTSATFIAAPPAEAAVGAFYGAADFVAVSGQSAANDPSSQFVSAAVAAKYWNHAAGKAVPAALCGAVKPDVAIVAGDGTTVSVTFFAKAKPAAQTAQVAVDPASGKISAITCAPASAPPISEASRMAQHFGVDIYQQTPKPWPASTKAYAPKSADGPAPWQNEDGTVCSQYVPESWVVYAPVQTSSGAAWQFQYDGNANVFDMFLDPANGTLERTLCAGFPEIPASDPAAAGKSVDGVPDPANLLVSRILDAYLDERSEVSLGAVPVDEIAPYFVTPAAFTAARQATGTYPFLCSSKAPDAADVANPQVSGSTESFTVTFTNDGGNPPSGTLPTLGKEKVTVDLGTMKIKSITCA